MMFLRTNEMYPVVAVIPSLNPDDKLPMVVKGLLDVGFSDVLLIDDGSRNECQVVFEQLSHVPGCVVLHHQKNEGKGRALKTAFEYYLANYDQTKYAGVVTADADGQHLPKDIWATAQKLLDGGHQASVIALGTRNFDEEQVPFKSRKGNKITSAVFKMLYGKWIGDTQTGLRAITNDFVQECLSIPGERFEYEINMLIQAVLKKLKIVEVIIETVYFNDNRETHFHPVKDSIRIYRVMFASFFRFACSGILSALADQLLFAVLQKVILARLNSVISIPVSTLIARVGSSFLNYSLNRKFVFDNEKNGRKTLIRYYALCVAQMACSALLVLGIHHVTRIDSSIIKFVVDLILFAVSYRIQRSWVFKKEDD